MAKRKRSADINQPVTVTVTGPGGGGAGGGAGTLPGTITGTTGNAIIGDRHYHQALLAHAALLGIGAADHHNPITIGNTGLSLSNQQVSLALAATSGLQISTGLMLADAVAGAGLAIASKVLAVSLATNSGLELAGSPSKLALKTPSTLSVSSSNTVTDALGHTHAITSSSNPGAAAAILASDASGYLRLLRLGLGTAPGYPLHVVGAARIDGDLTFVGAQKIDTTADSLTLMPAADLDLTPGGTARVRVTSGVRLQSDNYVSQLTGWGISYSGAGDFRYLYADELHAKAFIADLEQALAGGQIICKSVAPLGADFTLPAPGAAAALYVEEFKGFAAMRVFVDGDIVRIRQFQRQQATTTTYSENTTIPAYTATWHSGTVVVADGVTLTIAAAALLGVQIHYALSITNTWGTVVYHSRDDATKVQRFTFTRSTGANAGYGAEGSVVGQGTLVLDYGVSGNGFYEVNAIDGSMAENSPYAQVVTWTGHPATGLMLRTRFGNLRGVFNTAGEFGMFAGDGVADASQFLRISNVAIEGHNLPIKLYDGANVTVALTPGASPSIALGSPIPTGWLSQNGWWAGRHTDGIYRQYVGKVSGGALVAGQSWDGTTLLVKGQVVIQAGSSGIASLSDAGALATANTADFATQVSGAQKPANNATVGATWGTTLYSVPPRFGDAPAAAGLYLTAGYVGYWDGASAWPVHIKNDGTFQFAPDANNYIQYAASLLTIKSKVIIKGDSYFDGVATIAAAGGIFQGTGTFAAPTTGLKIYNSSGIGLWELWGATVKQVYAATDGSLRAGAGKIRLSATGLGMDSTTYYEYNAAVNWEYLGAKIATVYGLTADGYNSIVVEGTTVGVNAGRALIIGDAQVAIRVNGIDRIVVDYVLTTTRLILTASQTNISGGLNVGTATGAGAGEVKTSGSVLVKVASALAPFAVTDAALGDRSPTANTAAFIQAGGGPVLELAGTGASYAYPVLTIKSNRVSSTDYSFIKCIGDDDGTPFYPFEVRGDGVIAATGTIGTAGNMEVGAAAAYRLGDALTDGSWRIIRSGNDLVIQRRVSGDWVTKSTIAA